MSETLAPEIALITPEIYEYFTSFRVISSILCFVFILAVVIASSANHSYLELPPGPPRAPVLGNAAQIPQEHLATYLSKQVRTYGGLVSLKVFGTTFIVIGDMELAKEVLQKRSAKYSSRPVTDYYTNHIDPESVNWVFIPQNENNLVARRLTRGLMNHVRTGKWDSLQEIETLWTVQRLLSDGGKNWYREMQRVSLSTVFAATFGRHFPTGDEEDGVELIELLEFFLRIYKPSSLINTLPILDYIPGPMPWRKAAWEFRCRQAKLYMKLVNEALQRQADGRATWAAAFVKSEKYGDRRHLISQLSEAAVETTAKTLHIFFLACIMYPEWVERAQEEIDHVVGTEQVPSFSDRPKLPYVDAIVREVIRWRPTLRAGIPHVSTEDDIVEYQDKEYFIPKGSLVMSLAWHIEHDSARYHEPERFMPERFLDESGSLKKDYETSSFGFGRRTCPGSSFAERTLWINIANILWLFHVRKSEEINPETGRTFEYSDSDKAFQPGLVSGPFEFPISLVPRSPERIEAMNRKWELVKHDFVVA